MRADKAKNVAMVAKAIITDPLRTEREIADELWVNHTTVNRAKQELQHTAPKDDRIVGLTDKDFEIQTLVADETVRRLKEGKADIKDNDLKWFGEFALKRYQLLRWEATERSEVKVSDVSSKTDEELDEFLKSKLSK